MSDDATRPDDERGPEAALVALDWGTTTFRGWLLDPAGEVLEQLCTSDGTLRCSAGAETAQDRADAFERTFTRLCGPWLERHPGVPVLCAGMAGSTHGWAEAGYLDVPADLGRLADHLTTVAAAGSAVHIVPGLQVTGPDPDVMRGEEVQLVGALEGTSEPIATMVLPGTHSKWVRLNGARVTGFSTAMTGELYGLLMRDSILARLATDSSRREAADHVYDAFVRGLDTEAARGDERGLPALLFTARTLVMAGRLGPHEVADYVSGLLVGSEVRHALPSADPDPDAGSDVGTVAVCGSGVTVPRYRLALERAGAAVRTVGEDAAAKGLWHVALDAGLVAGVPAPTTTEVRP